MKRFQIGPARLRNGWEARIYALDGGGDYPVHGAYRSPGSDKWVAITMRADGRDNQVAEHEFDLLPNAAPVVSDAALDAFYDALGWTKGGSHQSVVALYTAGLAAAFAVMLAEQEGGE